MLYGIWDFGIGNWLYESRSVNAAILAFPAEDLAKRRAVEEFDVDCYEEALEEGLCEVRVLEDVDQLSFIPEVDVPAFEDRLKDLGAL